MLLWLVEDCQKTFQQLGNLGSAQKLVVSPLPICGIMPYLFYGRKWWTWISSISSSILLERCIKQAPIEGVLLCWSFSLFHVFQSTHVFSLYSCILILTPLEENHSWSETTVFLLGFPTCGSTNRFMSRDLCYVEFWCLLMFFQTKFGSSTCYSFFTLKSMREIFVAYAISKSPLALSTCSIISRFL